MANIAQNQDIARRLREVAQLLEDQGANRFRVRAYRAAAETIERLTVPAAEIAQQEGTDGLQVLPGIGVSLARSIHTLVVTGRLPMLDRLRGRMDPVSLLASIPGIGPALAHRLHDELHIETLEQLEMAAHDGRLTEVGGIGPKKLQGIIDSLTARLGRVRQRPGRTAGRQTAEPPVEELLDVDREYREAAHAGRLQRIAPHRFNPTGEAWLPILHTQRSIRHYSAMFSNTALAHRLKKTQDWVLLYYDDDHGERQCTVITSHQAPFSGKRIVRGREEDCAVYYQSREAMTTEVTAPGT
ncbi:MAG: helix-hairpin-helix domain-containing protein [Nitrospiraceae bacterium]|nr:helix-hairpin-helix domain-containing protein [Nitrospiraceae bacterium]